MVTLIRPPAPPARAVKPAGFVDGAAGAPALPGSVPRRSALALGAGERVALAMIGTLAVCSATALVLW